jgi:hypothetical protein
MNLGGAALVTVMGVMKSAAGDLRAAGALTSTLAVVVALIALTVPDPLRRLGRG